MFFVIARVSAYIFAADESRQVTQHKFRLDRGWRMKNTTMQLSRLLAAMTAATLMGCGGESAKTESDFTTVDPAQPVSDWQLVWSDDFDGSAGWHIMM